MEEREEHHSIGPLIGVVDLFKRRYRWGLDMNVGVFRKHVEGSQVDKVQGVLTTSPINKDYTGVRFGFNVYYWFCRE